MSWRKLSAVTALIASVIGASSLPSLAGDRNILFFHNRITGKALTGSIDLRGRFISISADTINMSCRFFDSTAGTVPGWCTSNGSGALQSFRFDFNGVRYWLSQGYARQSMSIMAPMGSIVLGYDGGGRAVLLEYQESGNITERWNTSAFSAWTDIKSLANSWLFYNSANGVVAVLGLNYPGFFGLAPTQTSSGRIGVGYKLFVTQSDLLMSYNPNTGAYEIGGVQLSTAANEAYVRSEAGTLALGFDVAVRSGRNVALYDRRTGSTDVGRIERTTTKFASWVPVARINIGTGWTSITATGDDLVLHNYNSGALVVGRLGPTGAFTKSYQGVLAEGYTDVIAVRR